jgi:hypothetical protein
VVYTARMLSPKGATEDRWLRGHTALVVYSTGGKGVRKKMYRQDAANREMALPL